MKRLAEQMRIRASRAARSLLASSACAVTPFAVVLLTFGPALAEPGYLEWSTLQGAGRKNPVFQFTAPTAGDYVSLPVSTGQVPTITRASTEQFLDCIGSWASAAASGHFAVGCSGLQVFQSSTNSLLNSNSPATQTTASLSTGSYTGWLPNGADTGSITFTVGTATATGLPCTATAGSTHDCHFSITVAGTIVATKTGAVTAEQLEPVGLRTAYIVTAGTTATRAADNIDVGTVALSATPSFSATVTLYGFPPGSDAYVMEPRTTDGTTQWLLYIDSTGHLVCDGFKTTDHIVTSTATVTLGVATHVSCSYDGTTLKVCVAGTCNGVVPAAFTPASVLDHLYLGWSGTTHYLNGFISSACADKKPGGCS